MFSYFFAILLSFLCFYESNRFTILNCFVYVKWRELVIVMHSFLSQLDAFSEILTMSETLLVSVFPELFIEKVRFDLPTPKSKPSGVWCVSSVGILQRSNNITYQYALFALQLVNSLTMRSTKPLDSKKILITNKCAATPHFWTALWTQCRRTEGRCSVLLHKVYHRTIIQSLMRW